MKRYLGAIKNTAYQTFPNNPCKFGTFVQKITLGTLRQPTIGGTIWEHDEHLHKYGFDILIISGSHDTRRMTYDGLWTTPKVWLPTGELKTKKNHL